MNHTPPTSAPCKRHAAQAIATLIAMLAVAMTFPSVLFGEVSAFAQDGEVTFRDDIYDRDDAILRALAVRPRGP
jgi:murein L,D-transpeptidase YcbB/YkuD